MALLSIVTNCVIVGYDLQCWMLVLHCDCGVLFSCVVPSSLAGNGRVQACRMQSSSVPRACSRTSHASTTFAEDRRYSCTHVPLPIHKVLL